MERPKDLDRNAAEALLPRSAACHYLQDARWAKELEARIEKAVVELQQREVLIPSRIKNALHSLHGEGK
jgi:hypothetical protein